MPKFLVLLLAITCCHLIAESRYPSAEPDTISTQISELIDISSPLLLDIQAGDLSTQLDYLIRHKLLLKGADIRELPEGEDILPDSLGVGEPVNFALQRSRLVRITLDLGSTVIERKSFLSYHSDRYPLYTFQIRQIALPDNRLLQIDSLSFTDTQSKPESRATGDVKWFEPVIASAVVVSLVYLLWTTE
jgi:hypothetical protein